MSDDDLTLAMAELQEVVRCRCDEAYRDRGLKDPHCECDSAEAVKVVASRIEALEAKLAKALEALLWCSGSADFNEGGVAREGWLKVCAPLLKGESHE